MKSIQTNATENILNEFVADIIANNPVSEDKATFKQRIPPYLSIIGPRKNFPIAMAHVDKVRTFAIICCGVLLRFCSTSPDSSDVTRASVLGKAHLAPMTEK